MDSYFHATNSPWLAGFYLIVAYPVISFLASALGRRARSLRSQKWAGSESSRAQTWWPKFCWTSVRNTRAMILDAYYRFSKHDQPFVLPQFGAEPWFILPQSRMKEVYQKPDDEVGIRAMLCEILATKYTGDHDIVGDPFHLDLVKHELTRKLPLLLSDVYAELVLGFNDEWRVTREEWTPIPIMPTATRIITRAANRVFSGTELCRNKEFLEHTRQFGQEIFKQAAIINMVPISLLQPLVAAILVRRSGSAKHRKTVLKYAVPVIEKRIQATKSGNKDPPLDCLQWLIEKCVARNDPLELDPARITRRLMRLNMVAIHTTAMTITNTLMDLYSSPRAEEYILSLREEVSRVTKTHHGKWSKAALHELHRIDSTIKESLRCSEFSMFGVSRLITSPHGIDLSDGTHLPFGTKIAVPNAGIHRDPEIYENPDEYDAFRFSRCREVVVAEQPQPQQHQQEAEESNVGGSGATSPPTPTPPPPEKLNSSNQGLVVTSETFLPFGYGRHACPGRFFATQEMKLMLAHIVMNYDVKLEGGARPRAIEIKSAAMPDSKVQVLVRLRGDGGSRLV